MTLPDLPFDPETQSQGTELSGAELLLAQSCNQDCIGHYFQAFFHRTKDAMVILNAEAGIVAANPAVSKFWGVPLSQVVQRNLADFWGHSQLSFSTFWQECQAGLLETIEDCVVRSDGTTIELEYSLTLHFLPDLHLAVIREVTGRKQTARLLKQMNQELEDRVQQRTIDLQQINARLQAEVQKRQNIEATLQHNEQRFRVMLENTGDIIVILDREGFFRYVSPASERILDYAAEQVVGRPVTDFVHPEDIPLVLNVIQQVIAYPAEHCFLPEYRVKHCNGSWRVFEAMTSNLLDDPSVQGILVSCRDISDRMAMRQQRQQAEDALRMSQARLAAMLEIANDAVICADSQQRITLFNQGAEKTFGYSAQEVLGQHLNLLIPKRFAMVHPQHVTRFTFEPIKARAMGERQQVFGRRKDSSEFPAEASISKLDVGGEISFAAILRDMTERYRIESTLRLQAERERLLRTITQKIHRSLNLQEILETTVTEVRQILNGDRALIYQFQPDLSGVMVVESVVEPWTAVLGTTIRDPCFSENYIKRYYHGRVFMTEDIYATSLSSCHISLLSLFQVRANLVVPILQHLPTTLSIAPNHADQVDRPHLWGLLIVHQCSGPRQWQPAEVELLRQLADQVGIASYQAELHGQMQQMNIHLEQQVKARTAQLQLAYEFESTLKHITDKVRDSLDEQQILQTAVAETGKGLGVVCCLAALFNLEAQSACICHEYTTLPHSYLHQQEQWQTCPDIYSQLLDGQPFQFCSLTQHPFPSTYVCLVCPIQDDRGVLGALWLLNYAAHTFHEQDIRLVEQVATQCTIALRQARLYQASRTQVEELARLNQLKDDFLSTVSHELRTPMANIRMATEWLEILLGKITVLRSQEDLERNPSGTSMDRGSDNGVMLSRYFQILKSECRRETDLINDLLDLARLDAGTEPLSMTPTNLQLWVPHIAESFTQRAKNQNQELIIDLPEYLPLVTTDCADLERILTELLHNACKYTPAHGQIVLRAEMTAQGLQLTVGNSGPEIPPDELQRIFDKFYRIPNNDPWKHGGTGLGLALVKKRVERLGLTISVSSIAGITNFTLCFPPNLVLQEESMS